MSLLDDLAKGQIYENHLCMIKTQFGLEPRTASYLFAHDDQVGQIYECICGRVFKVSSDNTPVWKEQR